MHCRFRIRCTEYISEYGMNGWVVVQSYGATEPELSWLSGLEYGWPVFATHLLVGLAPGKSGVPGFEPMFGLHCRCRIRCTKYNSEYGMNG